MYNSEKYIERCLNSILNQGIPETDYEVLILDDGSTDQSRFLVQKYVDKHSNVFLYSEENEGTYTSRNKLLKHAKGKYIYNVDADDYLAENTLKSILDSALKDTLDVLAFDSVSTYQSDDFKINAPEDRPVDTSIMEGHDFLVKNPKHRNEVWWYLIRAKLLEENQLVFEKNEYNADVVFTIKLFLAAKRVAYTPIAAYRYFQSEDSLMRNNDLIKGKRLIQCLLLAVIDLNKLILELEATNDITKEAIIGQLVQKRDGFIGTLVSKLITIKVSAKEIDEVLNTLKNHKIYPVKNYVIPENKVLLHKVFKHVINREYLVSLMSKMYP